MRKPANPYTPAKKGTVRHIHNAHGPGSFKCKYKQGEYAVVFVHGNPVTLNWNDFTSSYRFISS